MIANKINVYSKFPFHSSVFFRFLKITKNKNGKTGDNKNSRAEEMPIKMKIYGDN